MITAEETSLLTFWVSKPRSLKHITCVFFLDLFKKFSEILLEHQSWLWKGNSKQCQSNFAEKMSDSNTSKAMHVTMNAWVPNNLDKTMKCFCLFHMGWVKSVTPNQFFDKQLGNQIVLRLPLHAGLLRLIITTLPGLWLLSTECWEDNWMWGGGLCWVTTFWIVWWL